MELAGPLGTLLGLAQWKINENSQHASSGRAGAVPVGGGGHVRVTSVPVGAKERKPERPEHSTISFAIASHLPSCFAIAASLGHL